MSRETRRLIREMRADDPDIVRPHGEVAAERFWSIAKVTAIIVGWLLLLGVLNSIGFFGGGWLI